jgi:8-oxo-dGTP pyrophosphatase MutT (NUDIX family)
MIAFERNGLQFDFRVAAIAIYRDHVLLLRVEQYDFWFLPGGHVEMGEHADAALLREMREETGLDVRIDRLVWVVEDLYTLESRRHHELGFYYLVTPPPGAAQLDLSKEFYGMEETGTQLIFRWHRLDALANLNVQPSFLKTGLTALPTSITHFIQEDRFLTSSKKTRTD